MSRFISKKDNKYTIEFHVNTFEKAYQDEPMPEWHLVAIYSTQLLSLAGLQERTD